MHPLPDGNADRARPSHGEHVNVSALVSGAHVNLPVLAESWHSIAGAGTIGAFMAALIEASADAHTAPFTEPEGGVRSTRPTVIPWADRPLGASDGSLGVLRCRLHR